MSSLCSRNGRKLLSLCAVLPFAMLIANCSGASVASSSTIPTPARTTIPTTSPDSNGMAASGDLKRTSQGGNVTLEVTWEKDLVAAGDSLQFKVVMDTHSVDLDRVDLMELSILRNDAGEEVAPDSWDAPAGGHHRSGTIVFSAKTDGSALIGPQTKFIQLIVRDVAGVKERSFKWGLSS